MSETSTPTVSITDLPQPPTGAVFSLLKVEHVPMPHPYCITPKHVAVASDHWCGMLGKEAIRDAEERGAQCDICRKLARKRRWPGPGAPVLSYDEHENPLTVFVRVPQNSDLNAVPGLHAYLLSIKEQSTKLGIDGFAFPTEGQTL